MSEKRDALKILELNKNASIEEITKEYRKLARIHHPDKRGKIKDFERITTAYNTLLDKKEDIVDKENEAELKELHKLKQQKNNQLDNLTITNLNIKNIIESALKENNGDKKKSEKIGSNEILAENNIVDLYTVEKNGDKKKSEKIDSKKIREQKVKEILENPENSDMKTVYKTYENDPNTLHEIIRQMEYDCKGKSDDAEKVECQTNVKILKSLASNTNIDYTLATILGEVDNLYGKNSIKPPRAPSVVTKRTKVTESLYPEPLKTSLYSYDDDTEQTEVDANKEKIKNYGKFKKSLREIKNMHEQYEDATNADDDYILKIIKCNKYLIEEIKHRNTKQFQEKIKEKNEDQKKANMKEAINLLLIEGNTTIPAVNQMYFYNELKEKDKENKNNEEQKKIKDKIQKIEDTFNVDVKDDTIKNEAFVAVYNKIIKENINAKTDDKGESVHYQVNPLFIDQPYYKKYETKEENGGTVFNFFNAEGALALFANTNIKYLLDMYYDEDNKAHPGYQITKEVKETRRTNIDDK